MEGKGHLEKRGKDKKTVKAKKRNKKTGKTKKGYNSCIPL
jgi:hypothetical protein